MSDTRFCQQENARFPLEDFEHVPHIGIVHSKRLPKGTLAHTIGGETLSSSTVWTGPSADVVPSKSKRERLGDVQAGGQRS